MQVKITVAIAWIAVSFITFVQVALQNAEGEQFERGEFQHLHFANFKIFFNHMLNVSQVLDSIDVKDYMDCAFQCLLNMACFSFNLAISPNNNTRLHVCHLLATDKYSHSSSFVQSYHFHHYAIENPCDSFPCQNGGTCRPLYEQNDYRCECLGGIKGKHCEKGEWLKINTDPVCFGAKNDGYGTFNTQQSGEIFVLKLVHLSGSVACQTGVGGERWGCGSKLNTHITDAKNHRLFPVKGFTVFDEYLFYSLSGFNYESIEIEFTYCSSPLYVGVGQEFRVWFGEDLINKTVSDNSGKSCINVYGLYGKD